MRYYFDTEFIERGHEHPIELISIAMVRDDGTAVSMVLEGWDSDHASDWVKQNVILNIEKRFRYPRQTAAALLCTLVNSDSDPRFYAWYADYDWVVFCQLFGAMIDLPKGFPMFCRDVKQLHVMMGSPELPERDPASEHDALADALDVKSKFEFLVKLARERGMDTVNW